MPVYNNITDIIGNTPMLRMKYNRNILLKLESFNPFGSIKDRIAINMLKLASKKHIINKDSVIVEASSGNTGIALSAACSALGYTSLIVMPEDASEERKQLIKAYGSELILTSASEGMKGATAEAKRLSDTNTNHYYINQFNNTDNTNAHFCSTAKEIWIDTDGKVDFVVAGVGTGGTITGIAKYLKEKNSNCKILGILPENPSTIPGIGAGIELPMLQKELIDEFVAVSLHDAINTCNFLSAREGIFVGTSSGAAVFAANMIATRIVNAGKTIVAICPDSGERYLSKHYH